MFGSLTSLFKQDWPCLLTQACRQAKQIVTWGKPLMWTGVQIGVCLIFVVLAAFWAGKKLGQRRFYQTQEEMRALELSFKNLMEDMEMVSAHNMKVLETRTEEIKELLTVADRKCIYFNDLLKEMDESSASLRMRNLGAPPAVTNIEAGAERKFHKEVQSSFESVMNRMGTLSGRIADLEESPMLFDHDHIVELVRQEVARQSAVPEEAVSALAKTASARPETFSGVSERAFERAAERVVSLPMRPVRETFVDEKSVADLAVPAVKPKNVKELKIAQIDEGARLPSALKKTDLERHQPVQRPAAGYPVNEVLTLYENGVTLPQIARTLNMSKSEIELIVKIYGEGINMRKIV